MKAANRHMQEYRDVSVDRPPNLTTPHRDQSLGG